MSVFLLYYPFFLSLFSRRNQKKVVETTALKEAASNDKTLEKETNNGKMVEEATAKPETTAKCLEVEV
ncbi:hypothetical protein CIB84_009180 [Bambusicola thoracicus]|uniref:Uncharacterized protein n=1 Tax=Bambusicola thoracicus TaxID=9083 RepID=A0A2P4SSI1_BAMTH|nr:hypothetical protein CIB84_009180 [Bambusicola thoracicus]